LESIVKDIFRRETDKEPKNAGQCFELLENKWSISKKEILISTPYFYFKNCFKPTFAFAPFDYHNCGENDYYKKYNAIKHDRVKNIAKANINTLIRVFGALFILNIYFKDNNYSVKTTYNFQILMIPLVQIFFLLN
jgi:hypothetical protein